MIKARLDERDAAASAAFQEKAQAWVKDVLLKARPAVAQRPLLQLARAVCCAKRTRSGPEVVVQQRRLRRAGPFAERRGL